MQPEGIYEYGLTLEEYNKCVTKFNVCRDLLEEADGTLTACSEQLKECKKKDVKGKATWGGFGILLGIIIGLFL